MISPHRSLLGFTLLELMVSMAIGGIILTLAAALLGESADRYAQVEGNIAAGTEARAGMAQLGMDLSTATYHDNSVIEKTTVGWSLDHLGFFYLRSNAAQSEDRRIGDLCAVYYYVADQNIGGTTVRCLMRGVHDSDETFKSLRNGTATSIFTQNPLLDEPIAIGVVSFEVMPKTLDANDEWVDWAKTDASAPAALEIKLVLARRNLMGRLISPADWNGHGTAGKLLGEPQDADKNKLLEIYQSLIRYGNSQGS
jgi:prepilin-type N-terminal cleavage/methylation domain-containing protein